MPTGSEARRLAASSELNAAVCAIHCVLDLLAGSVLGPRERQLLRVIHDELSQIREAAERLE
jgi:hypothetical protein